MDSIPELKRERERGALTVIYQFGKDLVWLFSGEGDNFCAVFNSYPAAVLTFNTHQVQEGVIRYLTFKKTLVYFSVTKNGQKETAND